MWASALGREMGPHKDIEKLWGDLNPQPLDFDHQIEKKTIKIILVWVLHNQLLIQSLTITCFYAVK